MDVLMANAGRAFLKAFVATLLVVVYGVLKQPTLHAAVAVGTAGLMASLACGLAAIQTFVPELTFARYLPAPYGSILDSFVRAALGYFIVAVTGLLQTMHLTGWQSALVAAAVGAINAGLQAIQGWLTVGQRPVPSYGIGALATQTRREIPFPAVDPPPRTVSP